MTESESVALPLGESPIIILYMPFYQNFSYFASIFIPLFKTFSKSIFKLIIKRIETVNIKYLPFLNYQIFPVNNIIKIYNKAITHNTIPIGKSIILTVDQYVSHFSLHVDFFFVGDGECFLPFRVTFDISTIVELSS